MQLFTISYENNENKIYINCNGDIEKDYKVSIREISSNAPMYWFNLHSSKNTNYFCIPIPTHILKFYQNPFIRGVKAEFYDENNSLQYYCEHIINDIFPKIKYIDFEPFDCSYINYYEFFAEKFFDTICLNDLDLVIDIGANVGLFSKYIKQRGANEIIMIEANPNLEKNIKMVMGEDIHNCNIIMNPIFSEKKLMQFTYPSNNSTLGELIYNNESPKYDAVINVETITIDEIYEMIGEKRVSLFKSDIEGGEYSLFEFITDEQIKRVDKFLIEFHNNYNNEIDIITKKLEKNGYKFDLVELRMGTPIKIDNKSNRGFIITK